MKRRTHHAEVVIRFNDPTNEREAFAALRNILNKTGIEVRRIIRQPRPRDPLERQLQEE